MEVRRQHVGTCHAIYIVSFGAFGTSVNDSHTVESTCDSTWGWPLCSAGWCQPLKALLLEASGVWLCWVAAGSHRAPSTSSKPGPTLAAQSMTHCQHNRFSFGPSMPSVISLKLWPFHSQFSLSRGTRQYWTYGFCPAFLDLALA